MGLVNSHLQKVVSHRKEAGALAGLFSCRFGRGFGIIALEGGVVIMIALLIYFLMMLGILLTSFYIFARSVRHRATKICGLLTLAWCFLGAALYAHIAVGIFAVPLLLAGPFVCVFSIAFAYLLTRRKFEIVVSAYLISFGISFVLSYIANFFVFLPYVLINRGNLVDAPFDFDKPVYLLLYALICILQLALAAVLFRVRRFKTGFWFIFNKFTIVVSLIFTGTILILATWINRNAQAESAHIGYLYVAGVFISGIGIYILIRRLISAFQSQKAQKNTESYYEKLWREEKADKARVAALNKAMSAVIHNFADRIAALERGDAGQDEIQSLKSDLQDKLAGIKDRQRLPATNNRAIDRLFAYFARQFADDNIDFKLIVNGSIVYMVEHVIAQGALETLMVNHLKDAQIAVNASDSPFRGITAVLGLTEGCYQFGVFDSGIPFEADTLMRLGTGRVTTYADTGGSGIGFETTFETLRAYNASLIISEQAPSAADYSKSVTIRFDGKGQYVIKTYRPGDFAVSDRYVVAPQQDYI